MCFCCYVCGIIIKYVLLQEFRYQDLRSCLPFSCDNKSVVLTLCLAEEEEEFDMFAQTRGSSLAEQRKR